MPAGWSRLAAGVAVSLLVAGCGGGDDGGSGATPSTAAPRATAAPVPSTTATTRPPIEGVETFMIEAGHREGTIAYPETPPVGGIHNAVWLPCTFYDQAVPSERAVHSLEHGAIWITYRPDLPPAEVEALATLARSRKDVLVSRWDEGLPSPLVVTGWGRQLRLQSATDPRVAEFVRLYANQGPEINAPC